jgi:hypothetical protein
MQNSPIFLSDITYPNAATSILSIGTAKNGMMPSTKKNLPPVSAPFGAAGAEAEVPPA